MSREEARQKARQKATETKIAQEKSAALALKEFAIAFQKEFNDKLEVNKVKSKLVLKNSINDLVESIDLYNDIKDIDPQTLNTPDKNNQYLSKVNKLESLGNKLSKITFYGKALEMPRPSEQVDAKLVMKDHYFGESSDFNKAVTMFCTKIDDSTTCDQDSIVQIIGDADYCC